MSAVERLDEIEARVSRRRDHAPGSFMADCASSDLADDVPALVAALRAVLVECERHIAEAAKHRDHRPCEARSRAALAKEQVRAIAAHLDAP